MSCNYCGNKSGYLDQRGNCVSCGAPILLAEKIEKKEIFGDLIREIENYNPRDHTILIKRNIMANLFNNFNRAFACKEIDLDNGSVV